MIGALSNRTHNLTAGLALAGAFMFGAMILVLLLPKSPLPDTTRVNGR
jgi:hypothetical protein